MYMCIYYIYIYSLVWKSDRNNTCNILVYILQLLVDLYVIFLLKILQHRPFKIISSKGQILLKLYCIRIHKKKKLQLSFRTCAAQKTSRARVCVGTKLGVSVTI